VLPLCLVNKVEYNSIRQFEVGSIVKNRMIAKMRQISVEFDYFISRLQILNKTALPTGDVVEENLRVRCVRVCR